MNLNHVSYRMMLAFGSCLLASYLIGCGSGGPPSGTISGKVTLNGQPLSTGVVVFSNAAAGIAADAELNASGEYRLDTPIPAGPYDVAVQPPPPPPPDQLEQAAARPKSPIPEKYLTPETSGLKATIQAGKNTADFAL